MSTWIAELDREVFRLLAALVHDYLKRNPTNKIARLALEQLAEHSEGLVYVDKPEMHKVEDVPAKKERVFEPVIGSPFGPYFASGLFDDQEQ